MLPNGALFHLFGKNMSPWHCMSEFWGCYRLRSKNGLIQQNRGNREQNKASPWSCSILAHLTWTLRYSNTGLFHYLRLTIPQIFLRIWSHFNNILIHEVSKNTLEVDPRHTDVLGREEQVQPKKTKEIKLNTVTSWIPNTWNSNIRLFGHFLSGFLMVWFGKS